MSKNASLRDAYRYPGFVPAMTISINAETPEVYVLPLRRRQKKRSVAHAGFPLEALMTMLSASREIWIAVVIPYFLSLLSVASIVRGAA